LHLAPAGGCIKTRTDKGSIRRQHETEKAEQNGASMPTGFLVVQLSQVISEATAPAFLLGAVAAFVSVLIGRLNRIVDRGIALQASTDFNQGKMSTDVARLHRRANLINRAIEYAVVSGIFTTILVIVAFASEALGLNHAYGAAILFVLALAFFATSLIFLWREVRMAVHTLDQFL
jgi:hypothetical protein